MRTVSRSTATPRSCEAQEEPIPLNLDRVLGRGGLLRTCNLPIVEQRDPHQPSNGVAEGGRDQEKAEVLKKGRFAGENAHEDLCRAGYAVRQTADWDEKGKYVDEENLVNGVLGGRYQPAR